MSKFSGNEKEITLRCEERIVIHEFMLKQRIQVVAMFAGIISKAIAENKDLSKLNNSALAIVIIREAGSQIIDIYKMVTNKEIEWLENNITMDDEITIIEAIVEVNNIPLLIDRVSKMIRK